MHAARCTGSMKLHLFALGGLLLTPVFGATPELTFPAAKIEPPPRSLLESVKPPLAFDFHGGAVRRHPRPGLALGKSRLTSRMPVLPPAPEVHYHLQFVRPDEAIDYRMPVKAPEVISVK